MPAFTDFKLNIIEHVSKILDYFNKEKIVRIICMMFEVSSFRKLNGSLIDIWCAESEGEQRVLGASLDGQRSQPCHEASKQTLGRQGDRPAARETVQILRPELSRILFLRQVEGSDHEETTLLVTRAHREVLADVFHLLP